MDRNVVVAIVAAFLAMVGFNACASAVSGGDAPTEAVR